MAYAGGLWSRIVEEVSLEYPDVGVSYQHVDATTIHLVTDPGRFDVIVTDNLFGDILTDLAAAVTGGIGWPPAGTWTSAGATRACSSRCTVAPRTSPGRASRTRPRPCCPWHCCSTTSAGTRRPARWRPRWPSTWPPGPRRGRHTQSIGDRLAALVGRPATFDAI